MAFDSCLRPARRLATSLPAFQASDDSPHAVECELVEDGGAFVAHRPTADRPRRVAVVDGTLRTEARLTRTGPDGDVSMGLAGSWAAGAVLVDGHEPARFDPLTTGHAAIFTGGRAVRLPDHRDGWPWEPYAVDGADVEAADIAEALSNEKWLTVLDDIRHRRGLPVIGYVKTHHRRMLAREHCVRVPELPAGERSGRWRTLSTAATKPPRFDAPTSRSRGPLNHPQLVHGSVPMQGGSDEPCALIHPSSVRHLA